MTFLLKINSPLALEHVLQQQFPELAAFFEADIHDFKGHILRPVISHQGGGLQVSHSQLHLQLHLRSGSQMHVRGRQTAGEAGHFDIQLAILLQVCAHRGNVFLQANSRVPALPHKF